MNLESLLERLQILHAQQRWEESRTLLETFLAGEPDQPIAQIYYVNTLINLGEQQLARELIAPLLESYPDESAVLQLAGAIELNDEQPEAAAQFADLMIQLDPEDADGYTLMARARLHQRNYDAALRFCDEALAVDPEHTEALNLKIYVGGFLGQDDTADTITEALNLNPEDSSTIANHGYQLLRDGKVSEALDRLGYALSLNPTNQLARFAMLEALKARFWPYRLYFKYKEAMAKLSGGASMGVVIGLWFGVNALNRYAAGHPEAAPYVYPFVYLMVGLFLLTWIIDPIMNFYLLTNKYGRLLLDKDDKLMAQLVGGALLASLLCFGLSFVVATGGLLLVLGVIFLGLTIPLGTFLNPVVTKYRYLLIGYTVVLAALAFGGLFSGVFYLLNVAAFMLLGYQFLLNGVMAREGGRRFG